MALNSKSSELVARSTARPGYGVQRVFKTSLGKYVMKEFEIHKEALKGRGVNVVHGCDLQDANFSVRHIRSRARI